MVDRSNRRMMQRDMMGCRMNGGCSVQPPVQRQSTNGGCGCNNGGMSADCKTMMRRLQTVEFSMYDTMLYLDIYPECKEALAYFAKLKEERDALRLSLSKRCKRPVSACESDTDQGWSWIDSPWPWDPSAN